MPTVLTEAPHAGAFLISEANGHRSREAGVLAASQTIAAGHVLGVIAAVTLAAAGAAVAGNTGAATITATPAVAAGTAPGVYTLTAVSAGATAEFLMESPEGVALGNAAAGTAATIGGIGPFTITDAGTDPAVGDQFTITVTETATGADGQYAAFDQDATDGTQVPAAIAWDKAETGVGVTMPIAVVARAAEVLGSELTWPADITTDEKAAAVAVLATLGLIVR